MPSSFPLLQRLTSPSSVVGASNPLQRPPTPPPHAPPPLALRKWFCIQIDGVLYGHCGLHGGWEAIAASLPVPWYNAPHNIANALVAAFGALLRFEEAREELYSVLARERFPWAVRPYGSGHTQRDARSRGQPSLGHDGGYERPFRFRTVRPLVVDGEPPYYQRRRGFLVIDTSQAWQLEQAKLPVPQGYDGVSTSSDSPACRALTHVHAVIEEVLKNMACLSGGLKNLLKQKIGHHLALRRAALYQFSDPRDMDVGPLYGHLSRVTGARNRAQAKSMPRYGRIEDVGGLLAELEHVSCELWAYVTFTAKVHAKYACAKDPDAPVIA